MVATAAGAASGAGKASRRRGLLGVVPLLLLLAGCALQPPPRPLPLPVDQARHLLAVLEEQAQAFRDIRGLGRVRGDLRERSMASTQVLLAAKPDHFRTEVISPFGQPLLLLATAGGRVDLLDVRRGEFFSGWIDSRRWQSLTGLPLGPEELVPLLLYQVPVLPDSRVAAEAVPQGGYRLLLDGPGDRRQELEFDERRRLVKATWIREGERLLVVEYGDFLELEASAFPRSIGVRLPASGESVQVEFSEIDLNPGLTEKIFHLEPPAGTEIRPLPAP